MWYKIGVITALIAVVTIPAGLLTMLFASPQAGAAVFILGWLFFVPVIPLLALLYTMSTASEKSDDPLTVLKQQYAAGELDEEEFCTRVERLLETEYPERTTNYETDLSCEYERETEI